METPNQGRRAEAAGRPPDGDWTLLRRARAGDAAAWEELWRRQQDRLFRVALAVSRDPETARDVTHTVLLRVVSAAAPPREDSLTAYLTTAAWREAQRQSGHRRRLEPLESLADTPAGGAPDDEDGERRVHALAALEQLPAPQRDTLALRLVGGLSYDEVAHVLGIPVGTVRSRLHAGIRACRATLQRKGQL
ncbi:MAG: RNA polymerase sigma factor [Candidatus Delongbacteria bacterium]